MSVFVLLLVVSKQRYSDMGILQVIALQEQSPAPPGGGLEITIKY